jgi:chitin disaccharide deacetylase
MSPSDPHPANRLLGYPPDARLLILNADDFGFCHAINTAIIRTLQAGLVRSTTLMAPCPWAPEAMRFLADHPEIPFGVHLTVISDAAGYRWGPLAGREQVPSLVDETGYFYNFDGMQQLFAQLHMDELEREFRVQIETVLRAGLKPTHLDWHSLRLAGQERISDLMFSLAREYGLALRVRGAAWTERVQRQGLPCNDDDFLDSYGLDPATRSARYAQLLHALPAGLSEWAVHPGLDGDELLAIEPAGDHVRQADLDFWTSPAAKAIVQAEGITLLDYRPLQAVWAGAA